MKKLLKQIIQCGGHTPKYELYVPGASPIPDFSNKGANDNDLVILDWSFLKFYKDYLKYYVFLLIIFVY